MEGKFSASVGGGGGCGGSDDDDEWWGCGYMLDLDADFGNTCDIWYCGKRRSVETWAGGLYISEICEVKLFLNANVSVTRVL